VERLDRLLEQKVTIAEQQDDAPDVMAVNRGHAGTLAASDLPSITGRVTILLEPSERVRLAERPGLERGVYLRLR